MSSLRFYLLPLLGRCGIEENDAAVTRLLLGDEAVGEQRGEETPLLREAARQLTEYVQGTRVQFTVPLQPAGTPFQQRVWTELRRIRWGEFCTYGRLAERLDIPGGARAVGGAVGRNPIPILIPCHRVLAAGGGLGGFRLGVDFKQKLLDLEQITNHDKKIEKI